MKKTTSLFIVLFYSAVLFSQQINTISQQNSINGDKIIMSSISQSPSFIQLSTQSNIPQQQFSSWIKSALDMKENDDWSLYKTEKPDDLGYTLYRYQQTYKGIPIMDGIYLSHVLDGKIVSVNGEFFKGMNVSTSPSITEAQALVKALQHINADVYKWENKEDEKQMKQALNNPDFTYYPKGVLIIAPLNGIHKEGVYKLSYKFEIYAETPLKVEDIYIDATTGEVVNEVNRLDFTDAVGTAVTKYSGTQTITTDSYNGSYRLRETGRGKGIETYNCKTTTSYTNTDFTDSDNNWNNINTAQDEAAGDAHWGAEKTYDYYKNIHNRNSIDNNGFKLLSYVHYDVKFGNAFWDGQRMTYGDGDGTNLNMMTALDVCGHEITHGLTANTARLGSGESGALNEGYSDIFGTAIEFNSKPSSANWVMGTDIAVTGTTGGLRSFEDPKKYKQPDTYKGTNWSASAEVHTNDGPLIHWFYLTAMGGSGTNDNSNTYNVNGITLAKAEKIAFRTLTVYLTSSSKYADARTYSIKSAVDLYGACSAEEIATTDAWYAVGVGAKFDPTPCSQPPTANFVANVTTTCQGKISFIDQSILANSWLWDFGDGQTSTIQNPTHIYTSAGTYTVKLVATNANGSTPATKTSYINITKPVSPSVQDATRCGSGIVILTASGNNTLNWYDAPTGGTLVNTGLTYAPTISNTTSYYVANEIISPQQNVGEPDNTKAGGYFTANQDRRLLFDVLDDVTIKTVTVYANTAGDRTVEVLDKSGVLVATKTVTLPAGMSKIVLNLVLSPGTDYAIKIAAASTVDLYRNNGGGLSYPYLISNLISIKNSDATGTSTDYYYYFYNWEVQALSCVSDRTKVTGTVQVCTGINSNATNNIINIYPNPTNGIINFEKSGGTNKEINIQVLNVLGELQYSTIIESSNGVFTKIINLSSLKAGMYFISIVSQNEKRIEKIIKE